MQASDVLESGAGRKPVARWEEAARGRGATEVRYRDGQAMRVKVGVKHVVVDEGPPDWDGGSRGRVNTKGKRGPAFQ